MNHLLIIIYIIGTHTCFRKNTKMQKCKGTSAEPSLLELCRATQHFDDESKCKIVEFWQNMTLLTATTSKIFFTPLQAHGMRKITPSPCRKISLAKKKSNVPAKKNHDSNKILHISENKTVSLQCYSGQQNNNH